MVFFEMLNDNQSTLFLRLCPSWVCGGSSMSRVFTHKVSGHKATCEKICVFKISFLCFFKNVAF